MATPQTSLVARKMTLGIVGVLALVGLGIWASPAKSFHLDASNNLLTLIGNLSGTTNDMLNNTQSLHHQVQHVQSQLNQLNTESSILNQQLQTSQNLTTQLKTQQSLTQTGVSLMQQILSRQQQTESLTAQVADKANRLAGIVGASATDMSGLQSRLQTSVQESSRLNQQMDQLLAELAISQDEFKLFGQVDKLLSKVLPGSSLTGTLGSVTSVLGSVTGSLTGSGSPGGSIGSTVGTVTDTATNTVGTILGNLP